jgi:hypothetical protein
MSVLLDPAFDSRESWAALNRGRWWNPGRRETHDYIVANFDALAKTVSREAPGSWSEYAAGLCTDKDAADVAAFWRPKAKDYVGVDRNLSEALDRIRVCAAVRARSGDK